MVGNSHLRYSDYLIVDGQAMHAAVVQPLRRHAERDCCIGRSRGR